jgi:hypothetical protein
MNIMNNLLSHIDRGAIEIKGLLNGDYRSINACAIA